MLEKQHCEECKRTFPAGSPCPVCKPKDYYNHVEAKQGRGAAEAWVFMKHAKLDEINAYSQASSAHDRDEIRRVVIKREISAYVDPDPPKDA